MTVRITREAYRLLIDGDIHWLRGRPQCPERDHIEVILREAMAREEPPVTSTAPEDQVGEGLLMAQSLALADELEAFVRHCNVTGKPTVPTTMIMQAATALRGWSAKHDDDTRPATGGEPMKLHFDNDWLKRTIDADPDDMEISAGGEPSWLEQRRALCDEIRRLQRELAAASPAQNRSEGT